MEKNKFDRDFINALDLSVDIESDSLIPVENLEDYLNLDKQKIKITSYLEFSIAKFFHKYNHLPSIGTVIYYDPLDIDYKIEDIVIYENCVRFFCELSKSENERISLQYEKFERMMKKNNS
ncbi:MAG: hypothetical protein KGV57_01390 [Fusobacterium sp.]|nr:hypothetical protein [Fusobacterium sp.]